MKQIRNIELLAPAKNLECGIEAIKHGADAVYIGAPSFSARSAAANTLEDIKELAEFAHLYNAKVYVALNTILTDKELSEAEEIICNLYSVAMVDALIVQDMGITMLNLPPIALHASTQVDNRDPEKAKFLEEAGFQQIVLARELTVDQIKEISQSVGTPLEVFVHGALCVCYSGQCYLSQALSGRSANKGACAQYCRLPYTLEDSAGEEVVSKKHLLSMKDLNLSNNLEELIDAGASSLKIEGRLKDVSYVKNVVAYYRKKLDSILARRPEYKRASSGYSTYTFEPAVEKSFNRGFTEYFFHDRSENMWSLDSPKSLGELIGTVVDVTTKYIKIATSKNLNNGDGLCYLNGNKALEGMHINRVEGDMLFPATMPEIKKGTLLYRNFDQEFEKRLSKPSAERKIRADITIKETDLGFELSIEDEDKNALSLTFDHHKEVANKDQNENRKRNLSKTGNTIFTIENVHINFTANWFLPASLISEWKRQLIDRLFQLRKDSYKQDIVHHKQTTHSFPTQNLTYLGNVMNSKSKQFYIQHKSNIVQPAFEKQAISNVPLMFTRHCIKQSLGYCPKEQKVKHPFVEPFFLTYNKIKLELKFDCKKCEMLVLQTHK